MATAKKVAKGREIDARRVKGESGWDEPKYIHWGESDAGLADGNEALQSPRNESRVEGSSSITTTETSNDTYRVVGTITAEGSATIKEAGLFDGPGEGTPPSGDRLYIRGVFPEINLEDGDSLQLTIDGYNEAPE